MPGPEYLDAILEELNKGRRQWKRGEKILDAFGYTRRRQTAVDLINEELAKRGMTTVPVLTTSMPLDQAIRFLLTSASEQSQASAEPEIDEVDAEIEELVIASPEDATEGQSTGESNPTTVKVAPDAPLAASGESAERALVVGNLECSERTPETVNPAASVAEAMTLMDIRDYSQLVVATGTRSVRGIVSHKSIARAFLHGTPKTVEDCLDKTAPRVEMTEPLLAVVERFRNHDAVLVFATDKSISGIVTPADIAIEFGGMAGPFLIVGQIEEQLRWVARKLDLATALAAAGLVNDGAKRWEDLTMGELQRVLECPENWEQVGIKYDRATFCRELGVIRDIRNAVMHFRDAPDDVAFKRMKDFASVVQLAYVAVQQAPSTASLQVGGASSK